MRRSVDPAISQTPVVDDQFQRGNEPAGNAEIPVTINLCEKHLQEADKLGYRFEQKYANEILEMAFRKLEGL